MTLADEKDRTACRWHPLSYSQCDNDRALARAAQASWRTSWARPARDEVITIQRYAHLVGGARMAADERHGVVDQYGRSFAVPNLYLADGSVLPTQGRANPALTIMASPPAPRTRWPQAHPWMGLSPLASPLPEGLGVGVTQDHPVSRAVGVRRMVPPCGSRVPSNSIRSIR